MSGPDTGLCRSHTRSLRKLSRVVRLADRNVHADREPLKYGSVSLSYLGVWYSQHIYRTGLDASLFRSLSQSEVLYQECHSLNVAKGELENMMTKLHLYHGKSLAGHLGLSLSAGLL